MRSRMYQRSSNSRLTHGGHPPPPLNFDLTCLMTQSSPYTPCWLKVKSPRRSRMRDGDLGSFLRA